MTDVREHLEPQGLWRSREGRSRSEPVPIDMPCGSRGRLSPWALAGLTQTIEAEIIPRLVMAHKTRKLAHPDTWQRRSGIERSCGLGRADPGRRHGRRLRPNRNTARRRSLA